MTDVRRITFRIPADTGQDADAVPWTRRLSRINKECEGTACHLDTVPIPQPGATFTIICVDSVGSPHSYDHKRSWVLALGFEIVEETTKETP